MSDVERFSGEHLPVSFDPAENTVQDMSGMPEFDLPTFEERQGIINEILSREYKTPEAQVTDLNTHIAGWDDERWISYTYISGRHGLCCLFSVYFARQ